MARSSSVMEMELRHVLAQLRHAYAQLAAGTVKDQKQFANGLISPQIKRLEKFVDERP
jgi:hypothetical protein